MLVLPNLMTGGSGNVHATTQSKSCNLQILKTEIEKSVSETRSSFFSQFDLKYLKLTYA
jgi:hypothetical protein